MLNLHWNVHVYLVNSGVGTIADKTFFLFFLPLHTQLAAKAVETRTSYATF